MDLQKARLGWVELYAKTGDAGLVCRRCGITADVAKMVAPLLGRGTRGAARPQPAAQTPCEPKVFAEQGAVNLALRRERRLGIKQLRNELIRHHDFALSLDTIHRALVRHGEQVLKRPRRRIKGRRRYSRPVPGDRVQMDVSKICPGVYQYTAIDDCSRCKVVGSFPRRTAVNTLRFLEQVIEEMPFAIQRIQTDRGLEFFAEAVQQRLFDWGIKFRPMPASSE